ncbi:Mannan endo-1,6-alpha-mannosidase [Purpureocillium takamizusanense]|uniref:Mannan endo-1,6-alpha-mannosidase n=1 Tax=Purpureocillium takamizusanense TaxID=2060973 RepID=A0A9Q8VD95_9HYPO|nr:Mannan endo-1,6-alpha-mannosidase [Purpureocillium takamizusanense]UNI20931.1 Mannan endo-1,6-alpha-mannosidase [Purpureocillium takamizusanense]
MKRSFTPTVAAALLSAATLTAAQTSPFSIDSEDAILKSANTIAWDMLQYYKGNLSGQTPGILPGPPPAGDYYWWEGGAMWGTLIDYWAWTGDSSYNDLIMQAMQFQIGENKAYMPHNVTASLGNDDQGFWGMSAMAAAEMKFPNPPSDRPGWLALAQAVFNTQASPDRHDDTCGGGLRWQIPFANNGYNYKNSIANGCFFNLGARLYRYTGNKTFEDWAVKTWDWMEKVNFIDNQTYAIYDGGNVGNNCTDVNKAQFSYNNGVFALGAAFMWNATEDDQWKTRTTRLIEHGLKTFFPDGVAVEISCENAGTCTTDMLTFKGFVHRWYATITQIAPFTSSTILPVLKKSAAAAVKQCTGGDLGRQCGFKWASGKYDGKTGAGQEMSALAAVSSQLIGKKPVPAPVTSKTGGTSEGNPNAGSGGDDFQKEEKPITTADRAGAGILTAVVLGSACGMFGWMSMGI